MGSGKRITVALVGLVLLAVLGWLAKDVTSRGAQEHHGSPAAVTATVSPPAPRPAAASG